MADLFSTLPPQPQQNGLWPQLLGSSAGLGGGSNTGADPGTLAMLGLGAGLMAGRPAQGFGAVMQAIGPDAQLKRAQVQDTMQQIGLRNIQLQQQLQQFKWMQDIMNGAGNGTTAAPNPNAPQIAMGQGADQSPSLEGADGSRFNTGGIGPTVQNAQRMDSVPPVQVPAQSNNPFVQAASRLNMDPRTLVGFNFMFPKGVNTAIGSALTPTDATKLAIAGGQDPTAANAAMLRKQTFMPPTNLRPGGGVLDYNNLDANGKPTLFTIPSQPAPGTINMPTPGVPSGFTNVPVSNAFQNIKESSAASSGGVASGKAPFESLTLKMSDGRDIQLSPAEWAAYQQSGNLPSRFGQPSASAMPSGAPNGRYPSTGVAGPAAAIGVGQTPGAAAAQTESGKGSGQQLVNDNNWANGYATRIFTLNKALTGLQNADTGPGSETMNTAKSFLLAQTPGNLGKYLPGVDPSKIASYDEANKYLIQYAIGQAGSLGEGTDSKLATVLAGNANTHISNLAAQDVVRANVALERMKNAQVQQFNSSGLSPDQYQKWASQWNATINPAVFAWDTMTPDAKSKASKLMTPAQRTQFTSQYNWALQNRYIDGPQ